MVRKTIETLGGAFLISPRSQCEAWNRDVYYEQIHKQTEHAICGMIPGFSCIILWGDSTSLWINQFDPSKILRAIYLDSEDEIEAYWRQNAKSAVLENVFQFMNFEDDWVVFDSALQGRDVKNANSYVPFQIPQGLIEFKTYTRISPTFHSICHEITLTG